MRARRLCVCLASLLLLAVITTPLFAVGWTVTNLQPSGYSQSDVYHVRGNQQGGFVSGPSTGGYGHAALWSGSANGWIDLNPAGCRSSNAVGTYGNQQVGEACGDATGNMYHASLWNGTARSWVDLHPAGQYTGSGAVAVYGGYQFGNASYYPLSSYGAYTHAGMWHGTASSWVSLHPSNASNSYAYDMWDGEQVGQVDGRAAIWHSTAASYASLHPSGCQGSVARATSDGQQVGNAGVYVTYDDYGDIYTRLEDHAALWSGTAASWIDLQPANIVSSWAYGVSGGYQVGYAYGPATDGQDHAMLWHGTASSVVDLHALLPAGYRDSVAHDVYVSGGTISVVGRAYNPVLRQGHAILWTYTPVPEPSSILVLGSGLLGLCGFLRRRK